MNILEKIIAHKRQEIENLPKISKEKLQPSCRNFLKSLQNPDKKWPKLMAEIKPKSPSQGEIFPQADILQIAQIYEENGVSAISVLTDEYFFGGSWDNLRNISQKVKIPILCKEFILTENQIYTARQNGADAVLLMTQVLNEEKVASLLQTCQGLNMTGLVEIFDEEQLDIALRCSAKAILVNSRDFFDPNLKVDLNNFQRMLPLIPDNIVKVAASGLSELEEVEKIAHLCDAILVGTNFMKLQDYNKIKQEVHRFSQRGDL